MKVLEVKALGDAARHTACHRLNASSSRSHTILTLKVRVYPEELLTVCVCVWERARERAIGGRGGGDERERERGREREN